MNDRIDPPSPRDTQSIDPPSPPPPELFRDQASVSASQGCAEENSTNSTPTPESRAETPHVNSTNSGDERIHKAIIPAGTILTSYLDFARNLEESADCYLIGSILAVVAAILGRNVWFPFGAKCIFPNVFCMLVGKPGDRKSSAIHLAEQIGRAVLDGSRFLPRTASAEALFDEYDQTSGGSPDKILICDDANPLLASWTTAYGENVAAQFLGLFDCGSLSESFKRNLKRKPQDPESEPTTRRHIPVTSTSVLLGATFNSAKFVGHQVRAGLERRFLHYVARKPARMIVLPPVPSPDGRLKIENLFKKLLVFRPVICQLTSEALAEWAAIQIEIRVKSEEISGLAPGDEAILSRLNSQAVQILKVAMCFQACRAANLGNDWNGEIELDVLRAAQHHVELCHVSAGYLDVIGNQAELVERATVIYSRIQKDYQPHAKDGWITLSKSDLTSKFCHHDRRGSLRPHELYSKILPELAKQGLMVEEPKDGRQQRYRFHVGRREG